jgi:hypothetical protein
MGRAHGQPQDGYPWLPPSVAETIQRSFGIEGRSRGHKSGDCGFHLQRFQKNIAARNLDREILSALKGGFSSCPCRWLVSQTIALRRTQSCAPSSSHERQFSNVAGMNRNPTALPNSSSPIPTSPENVPSAVSSGLTTRMSRRPFLRSLTLRRLLLGARRKTNLANWSSLGKEYPRICKSSA